MDRFQLATLADWAGEAGLQGRKRLQKVVYFLQEAGCPLNAEFTLHRFGPYSRDVADVCDDMVAARLLQEDKQPNLTGVQYTYVLPAHIKTLLEQSASQHPERAALLRPFEKLAQGLLGEDLWQLELGSTILYFHTQTKDWSDAVQKACTFKRIVESGDGPKTATKLAQRIATFRPANAN